MLTDDEQQYKPARRKRHRCYLFHALRWNRVMDHFCPDELDLVSLHKALLYFSIKGPTFGNYYYRQASGQSYGPDVAFDSFLLIPNIKQIMRRRDQTSSLLNCNNSSRKSIRRLANKTDVFEALPAEVRQIIAVHLATQDFLTLRSVSRAMAPLYESTTFWQSRFYITGEYGYLYPAIREFTSVKKNGEIDWRGLFIRMQRLKSTPQLSFHACVWGSLRQLKSATQAFQSGTAEVSQCGHYHNYPISCVKNTRRESIKFDQAATLHSIDIAMVRIGYEAYVTGLIFEFGRHRKPPPVAIGHFLPGLTCWGSHPFSEEISTYSCHFAYPGDVVASGYLRRGFLGLSFCKDGNGIHSINVISSGDRRLLCTASCLQNTTANRTTLIYDKVTEVVVTLDHCKVVDLEIRGTVEDQGPASRFYEDMLEDVSTP